MLGHPSSSNNFVAMNRLLTLVRSSQEGL